MENIKIDNYGLAASPLEILYWLREQSNFKKLKNIQVVSDVQLRVTCPNSEHKNGAENKPSCNIYIGEATDIVSGTYHCFSCGCSGDFSSFVSRCLEISYNRAKELLIDRYGVKLEGSSEIYRLKPIVLEKENEQRQYIVSDKELDTLYPYHPYMAKRKLSTEICRKYKVKYDPKTNSLVFPLYDMYNNYIGASKRNVVFKDFFIGIYDNKIKKPVYLLNEVIKDRVKSVIVVESQIDALYLESLGYRAIATLGSLGEEQIEMLNKSGILSYILAFDGDNAGRNYTRKFIKNISKNVFISVLDLPEGKDINDLTKKEIEYLLENKREI